MTTPVLDVVLRDGATAQIRPLLADDDAALHALNGRVSLRTRLLRYLTPDEDAGRAFVQKAVHGVRSGAALVGIVDGQVVALAAFFRLERDPRLADLAMLVDDAHQGEGLGKAMLDSLADLALQHDVRGLVADVPTGDTQTRALLLASGFLPAPAGHGVAELVLELSAPPARPGSP